MYKRQIVDVVNTLRSENGCPWDRAQTSESMKKYIIEEAYETVQAINDNDKKELCEELGDLLFQVVFQAQIAKEKGLFDINDVIDGICSKMINRHPHAVSYTHLDVYKRQISCLLLGLRESFRLL